MYLDNLKYVDTIEDQWENIKSFKDNFLFLTGKIQSQPNGDFIDKIHDEWSGNHDKLERHFGYIQWLFPLPTQGVNCNAHPLQKHELEVIYFFFFVSRHHHITMVVH